MAFNVNYTPGLRLVDGADLNAIGSALNGSVSGVSLLNPTITASPASGAAFGVAVNTTGFTATAAQVAGASDMTLNLSGTLGAGANIQMPTAAQLIAVLPFMVIGTGYNLRIINSSSGAFAWMVTTNTGLTLTGTMSIAQNTWRDFVVTYTGAGAFTFQQIGTGTTS